MKKLFLLLLVLSMTLQIHGQDNILGKTNVKAIQNSEHQSWFNEFYDNFEIDDKTKEMLITSLEGKDYTINVYFGTWCEDSHMQVPRLIKILETVGYNMENLTLIGVDEDKVIPDLSNRDKERLKILNVPTIIVYEDGNEVNRFVEYPRDNLALDLVEIFSKKPYKHSYQD